MDWPAGGRRRSFWQSCTDALRCYRRFAFRKFCKQSIWTPLLRTTVHFLANNKLKTVFKAGGLEMDCRSPPSTQQNTMTGRVPMRLCLAALLKLAAVSPSAGFAGQRTLLPSACSTPFGARARAPLLGTANDEKALAEELDVWRLREVFNARVETTMICRLVDSPSNRFVFELRA